ncbi:MAG: hypothetical protein Ta2F_03690 [Termitinemataceae bacterium]|nr:MAG: hypothetical protein Ta2F_03690 [Termitinemataceae bacterium]
MFPEDESIKESEHFPEYQRMFSAAGELAILQAKRMGLPITYVDNDEIIKEYADGTKEVLGKSPPWVHVEKTVIKLE